ncbi:MAG: hypothetical protein KF778_03040 [Rhodocyclaceae bacterium]|nr:hypothetical protein [Rhodocyclaceae bacterium]MBX3667353.1 hypothetical protein [Rhodocyclaceae bacterium]
MNTDDRQKPDANLRRRNFLLTATLGGAGAVAAAVTGGALPEVPAPESTQREGRGYRVSEHVLNYYRSTRI